MRAARVTHVAAMSLLVFAPACDTGGAGGPAPRPDEAAAVAATPSEEEVNLTGSFRLTPSSGPAGTVVDVMGEDLPAGTELELLWGTADCDWVLEGAQREEYHGRQCVERDEVLDTLATDDAGVLDASFTVPEDYGFAHDVRLRDAAGVIRNRALFDVDPEVEITPTFGPVGTPVTIEIRGIGRHTLEDTRTILYDNRYVGFMSAVTTRGTARAVIPATGAVGPHHIAIDRGAYTFPYLNPAQSPRPDIPVFDRVFTVTEGEAVLPPPLADQNPGVVVQDPVRAAVGPSIATDLASGPVGTPFRILGTDLDPGAAITLQWFRIVGNRVSGQGWDEQSVDLGDVEVAQDGTFTFQTEIPGDVGGIHRIEAVSSGTTIAETSVRVTPQAQPLEVTEISWGTDITLHLTGVGWTETANIYTVVYDNAYVGYACGFNTQGDVEIPLTVTGDPGWHFIDLYPAIYKGEETRGRNNFRIPQLTYADDHPGEDLPGFRYAIRVEDVS